VRIVPGELADLPALAAAAAGQDAVLYAVEPSARGDGAAPVAQGVRAVVRAMRDKGLRRLVCLSVGDLGATGRPGLAVRLFGGARGEHALADVRQMEVAVRQSGLDWTIVRVTALNDRPGKQSWRTAPGYAVPHGAAIARADVARFMLGELDDRADVGHAVAIAW
jgi:uncharacterized protein YbjT (DUF2867 family)